MLLDNEQDFENFRFRAVEVDTLLRLLWAVLALLVLALGYIGVGAFAALRLTKIGDHQ